MDESDRSGINSIEWEKLLEDYHSDENYIYGYVTSEAAVHSVLEFHRRVTTTTFSVRDSSSLQFNPNQVDKEKTNFTPRSVFFSKSSSPRISDDGVPFIFGGKKILECQFGPRREHNKKREKQEGTAEEQNSGNNLDHDYAPSHTTTHKKRFQIQDTKKKGCEAKISVKHICRFPEYAVISKKNTAREQVKVKKRLLQDLAKGKQLTVENRFYIELPLSAAHTQHTLDGLSVVAQPVHPQIIQWIEELVSEGVTNCKEMQATLSHYVKTRMTDTVAPNGLDRGYYPRLTDIRNHIYKAKVRQRITLLDQQNDSQKLKEWKTEDVKTFFWPHRKQKAQSKTSPPSPQQPSTHTVTKDDTSQPESVTTQQISPSTSFPAIEEVDDTVFDNEESEECLLFVHQESWQQDITKQCGSTICLIDATYNTPVCDLALTEEQDVSPVNTERGIFQVKGAGGIPWHTVCFGDDTSPPSCDCLAFTETNIPCRHFFAVFLHYPQWNWNRLPPSYLNGHTEAMNIMMGDNDGKANENADLTSDGADDHSNEDSPSSGDEDHPQSAVRDEGDTYVDAIPIPRRKGSTSPESETATAKCRKALHEELDIIRAVSLHCMDNAALNAAREGLKAVQEMLRKYLDTSDEGLTLLPTNVTCTSKLKRKQREMDTTLLPLAKPAIKRQK